MFPIRLGITGLATATLLGLSATDAPAQYLAPQYFPGTYGYGAPSYGGSTYLTPGGGVVTRTAISGPYGTRYSNSYFNPYSGAVAQSSGVNTPLSGYGTPYNNFSSYSYNTPYGFGYGYNSAYPYGRVNNPYLNGYTPNFYGFRSPVAGLPFVYGVR